MGGKSLLGFSRQVLNSNFFPDTIGLVTGIDYIVSFDLLIAKCGFTCIYSGLYIQDFEGRRSIRETKKEKGVAISKYARLKAQIWRSRHLIFGKQLQLRWINPLQVTDCLHDFIKLISGLDHEENGLVLSLYAYMGSHGVEVYACELVQDFRIRTVGESRACLFVGRRFVYLFVCVCRQRLPYGCDCVGVNEAKEFDSAN